MFERLKQRYSRENFRNFLKPSGILIDHKPKQPRPPNQTLLGATKQRHPKRWIIGAVVGLALVAELVATNGHGWESSWWGNTTSPNSPAASYKDPHPNFEQDLRGATDGYSARQLATYGEQTCVTLRQGNPVVTVVEALNNTMSGQNYLPERLLESAVIFLCPQYAPKVGQWTNEGAPGAPGYGVQSTPTTTTTAPPPIPRSTADHSEPEPAPQALIAALNSAGTLSEVDQSELQIQVEYDGHDPSWALVMIGPKPGNDNIQGESGLAHLSNGTWQVFNDYGSSSLGCDEPSAIPDQVLNDFQSPRLPTAYCE